MEFFRKETPTATAQEKQVRVVHGKPLFYDPAPAKWVKGLLTAHLAGHRTDQPLTEDLQLRTPVAVPEEQVQ